jgi:hypothetical protein
VSAALLFLLLLPVARFVLVVVVVLVALVTKDDSRRDAAVSILPMVRSARACAAVAQQVTKDGESSPEN